MSSPAMGLVQVPLWERYRNLRKLICQLYGLNPSSEFLHFVIHGDYLILYKQDHRLHLIVNGVEITELRTKEDARDLVEYLTGIMIDMLAQQEICECGLPAAAHIRFFPCTCQFR